MSIEVMTWVGRQTVGSSSEKFVLLVIADHSDADGGNAWPSISRLCERTELSRRTVQRCLRSLEDKGWIKVDVQRGGTLDMTDSDRPNLYRVVMDGCHDDAPGATPRHPGGRHGDTRGGVMVSDGGRHGDAQTVHEPPKEPSSAAAPQPTTTQTADKILKWFTKNYPAAKVHAVRDAVTAHLKEGRDPSLICQALERIGARGESALVSRPSLQIEMNGGFQRAAPPLKPSEYDSHPASRGLDEVLW